MTTYRAQFTVNDTNQLILSNLPFAPGDVVEVVVRKPGSQQIAEQWKQLMQETQKSPEVQTVTDDDIAAEIEAYRSGL